MIEIFHAPMTRSIRVIWLCEELAVPYQVTTIDFSPAYRASPEWRARNPVGKVPAMTDGDVAMFESGAMVQWILERHGEGRLQPSPATAGSAAYLQWCWFAEATFGRATGELANHKRAFAGALLEPVMEEMRDRARSCVQALDEAVRGKQYLLGDAFSGADIMMGYSLQSFARHVSEDLPANAAAYRERITARPAFEAAVAANRMQ